MHVGRRGLLAWATAVSAGIYVIALLLATPGKVERKTTPKLCRVGLIVPDANVRNHVRRRVPDDPQDMAGGVWDVVRRFGHTDCDEVSAQHDQVDRLVAID